VYPDRYAVNGHEGKRPEHSLHPERRDRWAIRHPCALPILITASGTALPDVEDAAVA
jgi:hypothetical protein